MWRDYVNTWRLNWRIDREIRRRHPRAPGFFSKVLWDEPPQWFQDMWDAVVPTNWALSDIACRIVWFALVLGLIGAVGYAVRP